MKIIAFIFAKGLSRGLPNKNAKEINGIPLIGRAILQATESKIFDDIIVSTEEKKIEDIAQQYGASMIFSRPKSLAQDDTPEILCWKHAITEYNKLLGEFDYFVSLPCTSPLRRPIDITNLVKYHMGSTHDITLCITPSNRSPYFNMVHKDDNNSINLIIDEKKLTRRQDTPDTYDVTTVGYISSPKYIKSSNHIFGGNVGGYVIDKRYSIDIDDEIDFEIAETLLKKREAQ